MSVTLVPIAFCPVEVTLRVIGGKYKPLLLYYLTEHRVLRYGELRRLVPAASKKMLTLQLRELEEDGIVKRKVFHQVPPKVEYSLTSRGTTLRPVMVAMGNWGARHSKEFRLARDV